MRATRFVALLSAALAAGCAANPAPVPLTADPAGQALIVGEWSGDYYTSDGGRSGSILLKFTPHEDGLVCHGDVVMVPRMMSGIPANEGMDAPTETIQVLTIASVDVRGTEVNGQMAPYTDPETGETLSTSFAGTIKGNRITGTLFTLHARSGVEDRGQWEVVRK